MRKIKRFTVGLLVAVTACLLAVGLTGCTQKGDREKQEVAHVCTWEIQSETKATCTSDAKVKMVCKDADCGKTQTMSVSGTKLDHQYESDEVLKVAATCTKDAYIPEHSCVLCGGAKITEKSIPNTKLGHDTEFKDENSRNANCQEQAYCGVCGMFYGEKLMDHEPELVVYKAVAPTCLVDGHVEYVKCEYCTYTTYKKLDALGHDKNYNKNDANYCGSEMATCTTPAYCGVCKQTYGTFSHSATAAGSKAANCESAAYCGVCEEYYGEALGHIYETVEAKAQTCEEAGWAEYIRCTRPNCGKNTQEKKPALGHDWKVISAVEPTCTEIGWTAGEHCLRCRGIKVEPTVIPAYGHDGQRENPGEGVFISSKSNLPDCTRKGYCDICKTTYGTTSETGMHTPEKVPQKDPTCTEIGWYEYVKCKYCSYSTYEQNVRQPLKHNYVSYEAKEPTCTEEGYKAQTICTNCQKLQTIPAKGHDVDCKVAGSTKGNCLVQGYCAVCKEHYGNPTGAHEVGTPATCTEKAICRVCGEAYGEKLGHYIPATWDECVRCGKDESECTD